MFLDQLEDKLESGRAAIDLLKATVPARRHADHTGSWLGVLPVDLPTNLRAAPKATAANVTAVRRRYVPKLHAIFCLSCRQKRQPFGSD